LGSWDYLRNRIAGRKLQACRASARESSGKEQAKAQWGNLAPEMSLDNTQVGNANLLHGVVSGDLFEGDR
jgi:hypothetical protein